MSSYAARRVAAVAAAAVAWLVAGPAAAQTKSIATEADGRAATEIERRLAADREVNAQNVTIYVRDGVVTLTGRVPGNDAKRRAEGVAEGVPGVTSVRNRITAGHGRSGLAPTTIPEQMPGSD